MAGASPLDSLMSKVQGGGADVGAPPNSASLGSGPPPQFQNQLPPPTGKGAMPTGGAGDDKKGAIDEAIINLQGVIGYVPSLSPDIERLIESLKKEAKPGPSPSVTSPGGPGDAQSPTDPLMESGSVGTM